MHLSPYQNLYIYYLSGSLPSGEYLGEGFIGNWQEADSSFLFFSSAAKDRVTDLIRDYPDLTLEDEFQMTYAEWQGGQVDSISVGRFLLTPPWVNSALKKDSINQVEIRLDPGVVFGNGLHPTTRDSLAALELLSSEIVGASVLDLGTGTGILALGAARLEARRVVAVDKNPLAVQTAHANVIQNHLEKQVLAVLGRAETFVSAKADLIIANLHFAVMERIIQVPDLYKTPFFILSGLLPSEARKITARIMRQGVTIVKKWVSEGKWHTYLVQPG